MKNYRVLARDLPMLGNDDYTSLAQSLTEICKMLTALIKRLKANR